VLSVPAIDDGASTNRPPGPPTHHNPGPAPHAPQTGFPNDDSRSPPDKPTVGEPHSLPPPTTVKIRARIVPRCTSFASSTIVAEAMKWKNTVIIPERIAILRRESSRQCTATFCWHPSGQTRHRQSPAARQGMFRGGGRWNMEGFP
jgi:hypothetical protein